MERDPHCWARPRKLRVRVADRKGRKWKRRAPGRRPRVVGSPGDAERLLGPRIVGLEVLISDRPVVGDSVKRAKTKVVSVKSEGVPLPMQRAAADPAGPLPVEEAT